MMSWNPLLDAIGSVYDVMESFVDVIRSVYDVMESFVDVIGSIHEVMFVDVIGL
jgi:hypothetical protein